MSWVRIRKFFEWVIPEVPKGVFVALFGALGGWFFGQLLGEFLGIAWLGKLIASATLLVFAMSPLSQIVQAIAVAFFCEISTEEHTVSGSHQGTEVVGEWYREAVNSVEDEVGTELHEVPVIRFTTKEAGDAEFTVRASRDLRPGQDRVRLRLFRNRKGEIRHYDVLGLL